MDPIYTADRDEAVAAYRKHGAASRVVWNPARAPKGADMKDTSRLTYYYGRLSVPGDKIKDGGYVYGLSVELDGREWDVVRVADGVATLVSKDVRPPAEFKATMYRRCDIVEASA